VRVNCCVVVTGPPCTGKSTLARALASRRGWPLLAKDDYKERVFDRLGWSDVDWSRRVSVLAWDLAFQAAAALAVVRASFVLEGNLRAEHAQRLRALAPPPRFVLVQCQAPGELLVARFRARAASGARHPGHRDAELLARIAAELAAGQGSPLALGGPVLRYDTGAGFDVEGTLARIDAALAASGPVDRRPP
jgi:predicted kinase